MIGSFKLPIAGGSTGGGSEWSQEKWQAVYDTSYTRPSEWLTLPTLVNGNEKVVLLHKVENHDSNFCAFIVTGDYIVNWGDGSAPQSYSSGTTALKIFNYNASGIINQTPTSQGYRQVIVTITPQAGQTLTSLVLNVLYPSPTGITLPQYATGWLDIRMAGQNFTRVGIGGDYISGAANGVNHKNLELFDYVGTLNASFTNGSYIFNSCSALRKIVNLDTSKFTNTSSMFNTCSSLTTIPLLNTSLVSNTSSMFASCYSLSILPFLNLQSLDNASNMFNGCNSLAYIPLFNLSLLTNASSMFSSCGALTQVPLFNLSLLTNASSMFQYCSSLVSVPLFTFTSLIIASSLFRSCTSIITVPLFNLSSVTNTSNMFNGCYSLVTVPLFNLSSVTDTSSMFFTCYSLSTVPLFNLSSVITATSMFSSCSTLNYIPLFNLSSLVTGDTMFQNCFGLSIIPAFDLSSLATGTSMFAGCTSESSFLATNIKSSFHVSSNRLSKVALESLFNSLVTLPVAKTIVITSNYGADVAISKASSVTTTGSAVITQTNTASLIVGMRVTGTGIDTAVAVSFTDIGDIVTRTAHGLVDNKKVAFPTIVTTTGIVIRTIYYVINATANTFQVSLTLGGAPINIITDGTGTMYYPSYITSINPNISYTIDVPASASGTITTSNRLLDTSAAIQKGWSVSG